MNGLEHYIEIHGKHLTEDLAYMLVPKKWSSEDIIDSTQKKVYYNVISATPGDMVYIINKVYALKGWSKNRCINYCLDIVGDFSYYDNYILEDYIELLQDKDIKINFEDFI